MHSTGTTVRSALGAMGTAFELTFRTMEGETIVLGLGFGESDAARPGKGFDAALGLTSPLEVRFG